MASALTVAGSDSGGGAGVQADLHTFQAFGVHGTSVVTCVTAQNPRAVLGVHAIPGSMVRLQWEAVVTAFPPAAVKTGMLLSRTIIDAVVACVRSAPPPFLVVDPVMVSTSGAALLEPGARRALMDRLLPMASLLTPNLDEARLLSDLPIRDPEDLRKVARALRERFGCAVLVKGGHMEGPEAVDVLWDGREEWLLTAARVPGVSSHGTGCTYAAAVAAGVARGKGLTTAVHRAKAFITRSMERVQWVEGHPVLGWRQAAGTGV